MIAIFLADGFEEIEVVTTIDFLRRCELKVQTITIGGERVQKRDGILEMIFWSFPRTIIGRVVKGSHDIFLLNALERKSLKKIKWEKFSCIILPGGMPGTKNLEDSEIVNTALETAYQHNKLIAAICAAPSILAKNQMLKGKYATCFPNFKDVLLENGVRYKDDYVVEDGNFITAKGAGCTIDFAQAIAARFVGDDKAQEVREAMQTPYQKP